MHHQFKGSLRKIPQDQYSSLSNSRQFPQPPSHPHIRNQLFYRTQRSEYSSVNRLQSTSNFDRQSSSRYMYDKNIPVKMSSSEKMEHEVYLRVEMEVSNEKPRTAIKINLTDDGNHKLLWCLYLKDVNYMSFKMEQQLKVDFGDFPNFLIKMLDFLLESQKKYICRFEMQKTYSKLKILESNEFKENLNLELKFIEATNEQLIEYMNEKITKSEEIRSDMSIEIEKNREEILRHLAEKQEMNSRLGKFQTEKMNEVSNLSNQSKTKIMELREEFFNKEAELKKEIEMEKKQITKRYEADVLKMKQKYEDLIKKYELSTECNERLESKKRQLESKTTILLAENENLKKNYQAASDQLGNYQQSAIEQERLNTELRCKVQSLTHQIRDKQIIIQSTKEIKTNQSSQVQTLEANIVSLKKELEKQDKMFKDKMDQIEKFKAKEESYIVKNKEKTTRLKDKDQVILNIYKDNEELKIKAEEKQRILSELTRQRQKSDNQFKIMKDQLSTCKAQIIQNAKTIQQSSDMIKHLQKQLTQQSMGSARMGQFSNTMQSNYRPSFNYQAPSTIMSKSSLSPSIPTPVGERIQPQIKKYSGSTNFQIPILKTENTNALNQEQQSEDFREHTLRVHPVKYRSPSQTKS